MVTQIKGTLSNDDYDGSENAAKKMNLSSFKLNRVYLDPFNMSNAGDFFLRILFKFKKRLENSSLYVHVLRSIKRQIRRFHVVVVQ